MNFFRKELASSPVKDSNGLNIPFESCAGDEGVLALDDNSPLLADLLKLIGRCGISRIDQSRYDEIKKKLPSLRRNVRLRGPRIFDPANVSLVQSSTQPVQQLATAATAQVNAAVAAVKSNAENVVEQVQSKVFRPRKGKSQTKQ